MDWMKQFCEMPPQQDLPPQPPAPAVAQPGNNNPKKGKRKRKKKSGSASPERSSGGAARGSSSSVSSAELGDESAQQQPGPAPRAEPELAPASDNNNEAVDAQTIARAKQARIAAPALADVIKALWESHPTPVLLAQLGQSETVRAAFKGKLKDKLEAHNKEHLGGLLVFENPKGWRVGLNVVRLKVSKVFVPTVFAGKTYLRLAIIEGRVNVGSFLDVVHIPFACKENTHRALHARVVEDPNEPPKPSQQQPKAQQQPKQAQQQPKPAQQQPKPAQQQPQAQQQPKPAQQQSKAQQQPAQQQPKPAQQQPKAQPKPAQQQPKAQPKPVQQQPKPAQQQQSKPDGAGASKAANGQVVAQSSPSRVVPKGGDKRSNGGSSRPLPKQRIVFTQLRNELKVSRLDSAVRIPRSPEPLDTATRLFPDEKSTRATLAHLLRPLVTDVLNAIPDQGSVFAVKLDSNEPPKVLYSLGEEVLQAANGPPGAAAAAAAALGFAKVSGRRRRSSQPTAALTPDVLAEVAKRLEGASIAGDDGGAGPIAAAGAGGGSNRRGSLGVLSRLLRPGAHAGNVDGDAAPPLAEFFPACVFTDRDGASRVVRLTLRVQHSVVNSVGMVLDVIGGYGDQGVCSILVVGPQAVGKTSFLRDCCRHLSTETRPKTFEVSVVDTRSRMLGDLSSLPPTTIGRARLAGVAQERAQHELVRQAVDGHMAEVVVVDELDGNEDVSASALEVLKQLRARGVAILAGAQPHIKNFRDVLNDPVLRQFVCPNEPGQACFDVVLEMPSREEWVIHRTVSASAGVVEMRQRDRDGTVWSWYEHLNPGAPAPAR